MDQRKVQAIREWESPTNIHNIQEFLGFANSIGDSLGIAE